MQSSSANPVQSPSRSTNSHGSGPSTALAASVAPEEALARYARFQDVVDLIRARRDVKLLVEIETCLRLVSYRPGRIEFTPTDDAPRDLAARLGQRLQNWSGNRWAVSVVSGGDAATIAEERDAEKLAREAEALKHPMVKAVFEAFPAAKITAIRTPEELAQSAAVEALPEVEDEWDPFEDN